MSSEVSGAAPAALQSLRHAAARSWAWMRAHPVLAIGLLPALALAYVLALIPFTPSVADIRQARTEQPSVLMSADGKELAAFRRANREWIKLEDISPDVVKALIATEDHRFYEHHGIDVQRTISAVLHTLGGSTQGGSTITQQLARNFYPDQIGRAVTINRKLREAITALKIEAVYSKDEILETYLNTVPFLYNAWGIEMAARTYFDRSADRLDVLQSATLIGMLKGTTYYNPVLNPERAEQRRNIVLAQMVKRGQLDASRLDALKARPLGLNFEQQTEAIGAAPHLSRFLKRWLIEWADRAGYNIYADGLVVRTTIDARLQNLAVQAVERQTERLQSSADAMWAVPKSLRTQRANVWRTLVRETPEFRKSREMGLDEESAFRQLLSDAAFVRRLREEKMQLAAGFLALEPATGQVRAWVGSRDFAQDQFDHVAQARRQPGSTFKPFVYGAAFEAGLKPWDVLMDDAVEIAVDNGNVWRPTDGGGPSGLPMSLRDGLAYSKNTITAQLMQKIGPASVARLSRALGVRNSKLDEVLSLGLGTSPVTLKEMVAAYGSIANNGAYIEPVLVTRVEDRHGKVLEEFGPRTAEPGMSPASALQLVDALRGAVDRGTGTAIRSRFGIEADVAGKTGTTQDNTDAWFILMHPQLVGGAWVGFNDNRVTMGSDWGQGARGALPIVGDFFQHALRAKAIDAQYRFATPPADPAPAPPLVEPAPAAPAAQPDTTLPPVPAEQQVMTDTAPVFGGVRRVDRVDRATVGVSGFPPLPERREQPAATIIAPAPAAVPAPAPVPVAQPLPAPEPAAVVASPVTAPARLEPRPVTQIITLPPQPLPSAQRPAPLLQDLPRAPMPEPMPR